MWLLHAFILHSVYWYLKAKKRHHTSEYIIIEMLFYCALLFKLEAQKLLNIKCWYKLFSLDFEHRIHKHIPYNNIYLIPNNLINTYVWISNKGDIILFHNRHFKDWQYSKVREISFYCNINLDDINCYIKNW